MNSTEKVFSELSDKELVELSEELNQASIPLDSIARRVSHLLFSKFDLVQAVGLGIPLSNELVRRMKQKATSKQKLVDIMFSVALTIHNNPKMNEQSTDEVAAWVVKQLEGCGFPTKPCGSSWGILTDKT